MKANVPDLYVFIKIRIRANLFERFIISTTKGNQVQVHRRNVDKKTKWLLLLEHAHIVRIQLPIGALSTMQELEPVEETQEDTEHVISLKFGYANDSGLPPDL